jgi:hypothetical protein
MKSATTFVLIRASKLSFTAVITRFSRHQNSRGSNQVVVKKKLHPTYPDEEPFIRSAFQYHALTYFLSAPFAREEETT